MSVPIPMYETSFSFSNCLISFNQKANDRNLDEELKRGVYSKVVFEYRWKSGSRSFSGVFSQSGSNNKQTLDTVSFQNSNKSRKEIIGRLFKQNKVYEKQYELSLGISRQFRTSRLATQGKELTFHFSEIPVKKKNFWLSTKMRH